MMAAVIAQPQSGGIYLPEGPGKVFQVLQVFQGHVHLQPLCLLHQAPKPFQALLCRGKVIPGQVQHHGGHLCRLAVLQAGQIAFRRFLPGKALLPQGMLQLCGRMEVFHKKARVPGDFRGQAEIHPPAQPVPPQYHHPGKARLFNQAVTLLHGQPVAKPVKN